MLTKCQQEITITIRRELEGMHVISRKPFIEAANAYPNDAEAIMRTYKALRGGKFTTPDQMRNVFPSLDNFKYRDKWWVLDIGGNNLRLVAFIEFKDQRMFIKHIVTHEAYDKLCNRYRREEI